MWPVRSKSLGKAKGREEEERVVGEIKKKSGEQNSLNETPGTLRSDIYEKRSHGERLGGQN